MSPTVEMVALDVMLASVEASPPSSGKVVLCWAPSKVTALKLCKMPTMVWALPTATVLRCA